jgi:hypothetical protein
MGNFKFTLLSKPYVQPSPFAIVGLPVTAKSITTSLKNDRPVFSAICRKIKPNYLGSALFMFFWAGYEIGFYTK